MAPYRTSQMGIFASKTLREHGEKRLTRRQRTVISETLSLEQLAKFHSRCIALGHHSCIEQQLPEVSRAGKRKTHVHGLELVHEVNQDLNARREIQHARYLAFQFERSSDALVVFRTLQAAFVFQGETGPSLADPHVHDGVIVLL